MTMEGMSPSLGVQLVNFSPAKSVQDENLNY